MCVCGVVACRHCVVASLWLCDGSPLVVSLLSDVQNEIFTSMMGSTNDLCNRARSTPQGIDVHCGSKLIQIIKSSTNYNDNGMN